MVELLFGVDVDVARWLAALWGALGFAVLLLVLDVIVTMVRFYPFDELVDQVDDVAGDELPAGVCCCGSPRGGAERSHEVVRWSAPALGESRWSA